MRDNPTIAEVYHQNLIRHLRQQAAMQAPGVAEAFASVPRHLFLPGVPLDRAYADEVVPLKYDAAGMVVASSSQPTMMAIMLDQLRLQPGDNVLEIGTATGFNAGLMQHIVGHEGRVTTVEIDQELARQALEHLRDAGMAEVKVVPGDGSQGYAPRASYDHIIATAGVWDVPAAWLRQLKPEGSLVVPIWVDGVQVSATFRMQLDGTYISDDNRPCAFVYLRGESAGPEMRRRIGSSSLVILSDDVDKVDTVSLQMLLSDDASISYLDTPLEPPDFWHGFQLHLMLSEPKGSVFVVYAVNDGQQAFGMSGRGVALLTPGSAAFASYFDRGAVHCFAGSDAFIAMQSLLDEWLTQDRPRTQQLRLQLVPRAKGRPQITQGRAYERRDHYLVAWLDLSA